MDNKPDTQSLDRILEADDKFNARMSESQFKGIALPIIIHATQAEESEASLQSWLDITGSWTRGIDVLDDNTEELLFKVPALVGRTEAPEIGDARNSAYEIIENAKKKMTVSPRAGVEHLNTRLSDKLTPAGDHDENQRIWNSIFKRYGLDELITGDVSEVSDVKPSKNSSEIEGYDEV